MVTRCRRTWQTGQPPGTGAVFGASTNHRVVGHFEFVGENRHMYRPKTGRPQRDGLVWQSPPGRRENFDLDICLHRRCLHRRRSCVRRRARRVIFLCRSRVCPSVAHQPNIHTGAILGAASGVLFESTGLSLPSHQIDLVSGNALLRGQILITALARRSLRP